MIGDKHPCFEFLQLLSSKCSFNVFSSEHVRCILDQLSGNISGYGNLEASSTKLLLVRIIYVVLYSSVVISDGVKYCPVECVIQ